jgi:hypothetical protein
MRLKCRDGLRCNSRISERFRIAGLTLQLFNPVIPMSAHFPRNRLEPGGFHGDHGLCLASWRGKEISEIVQLRSRREWPTNGHRNQQPWRDAK